MSIRVIQRIIGLLLMIFSITMLPAMAVSLFYADGEHLAFLGGFGVTALAGIVLWFPVRKVDDELRLRDGFLVVAGFWVVLGLFGAAPLLLAEQLEMKPIDAVFESMSGLTTTGATVLTGLDALPRSILYYRQQLQWLGGMGIIVLAVAVLPMLGVGGMQLYRAETPGPVKDTKLTPRITETAKALWYIYVGITIVCVLAYMAAGMDLFDAIGHGFSTVAIGGFSTHDASIGHFESPLIEMTAVVFMFIAGINFSLHFLAWRTATLGNYLRDPEFRAFVTVLGTLTFMVTIYLVVTGHYPTVTEAFTKAIFQAVSIGTTTGFTTADYSVWPGSLPVALILASFIGGCAGSTGGGMKVVRWLLIYKQGVREVRQLVHPSAQIPVKIGSKAVPERVIGAVWGFFAVYIILFGVMMLMLLATGLDQVTAFSAVAAALNNLGPGLGDVSGNFASISTFAKAVSIAAMLLGRLEIFTLFVLFTPTFWQR
ncbi:MAG: TrkH family potassium uptake protein [Gammaproteobacteria bacterium]|nr:TrkH family potassium uptake protein [Gammaproteobacteria bacterium]NNF62259.1 potassium transporter [Gammaproteobacteria bacterium]NNM21056.1 potassium transporter [Gammaproteobacteria bacterium]